MDHHYVVMTVERVMAISIYTEMKSFEIDQISESGRTTETKVVESKYLSDCCVKQGKVLAKVRSIGSWGLPCH